MNAAAGRRSNAPEPYGALVAVRAARRQPSVQLARIDAGGEREAR
jgi:hypothetical protein